MNLSDKQLLWSVLERYDGVSDYEKFCDSISRFIQGTQSGDDMLSIYLILPTIETNDRKVINETIGYDIDAYLFSI